jgi:hypothetical protein
MPSRRGQSLDVIVSRAGEHGTNGQKVAKRVGIVVQDEAVARSLCRSGTRTHEEQASEHLKHA